MHKHTIIVNRDYAPEEIKTAFFDAFDELHDYRVIFSYKGKIPHRPIPPHLKLVKWAPQLDILAHPKTKVFLTHSGLKRLVLLPSPDLLIILV